MWEWRPAGYHAGASTNTLTRVGRGRGGDAENRCSGRPRSSCTCKRLVARSPVRRASRAGGAAAWGVIMRGDMFGCRSRTSVRSFGAARMASGRERGTEWGLARGDGQRWTTSAPRQRCVGGTATGAHSRPPSKVIRRVPPSSTATPCVEVVNPTYRQPPGAGGR